ncbi:MAG: hypothetical protein KatS3mg078_0549 [Deltaproteobacteria bacterium]|jgi:hypothetical protein|nr:MAG: hypothetical protein KatS3mg078_0549 [Deltaproteobacteria bacterium]
MEGKEQVSGVMGSVVSAFNMGVSARQQAEGKSVVDVAHELGQIIYSNLTRIYGSQQKEELILANTEYFLQIALLGYIIPGICAYDEGLKNRLFALIEAKLNQVQQKDKPPSTGGRIITP